MSINQLYLVSKECKVSNENMSCIVDLDTKKVKLYRKYKTSDAPLLQNFLKDNNIENSKSKNIFNIRLSQTNKLKSNGKYVLEITNKNTINIKLKPCKKVKIDIDNLERFKYTDNYFYIYPYKDKESCQVRKNTKDKIMFRSDIEINNVKICEEYVWIRGVETQCFDGENSGNMLTFEIPTKEIDTLIIVENNQLFGGDGYKVNHKIKEKLREIAKNNSSKLMILESDGSRIRDNIHSIQHLSFQSPDGSFMPFLYLSDLLTDIMDSEQGIENIIYFTAKNGLNKPLPTEFAFLQWRDKIKVFTIEENKKFWEEQLGKGETHVETIK